VAMASTLLAMPETLSARSAMHASAMARSVADMRRGLTLSPGTAVRATPAGGSPADP
jgi:hypothetical protein